jgi:hypothetical protein
MAVDGGSGGDMGRDVGGMAEAELKKWAYQVGIVPNPAFVDREGWDFLLQFPFSELQETLPLDVRSDRIECLIQVKGLDVVKYRRSIKLSNWERLVRTPLPAFFLVIDFNWQASPKNAYLVHVGKEWIEKVLHRLRKLKSEDSSALNEKYLDLTWDQGDCLAELNGNGLKRAIEAHVRDSMKGYCLRKIEFRETAGDPIPALMHVSTTFQTIEEGWNVLMDFAIGIRDDLPTSRVTVEEDVRFDIPAKRKRYDTEGVVEVEERPATPVKLVVYNRATTLRSEFSGLFHSPYWFFKNASIPDQYMKNRVSFELGDIIIYPSSNKARVNLSFSQAEEFRSLQEHVNLWRLVDILQVAQIGDIYIDVRALDDSLIGSAVIAPLVASQLEEELLQVAHAVNDFWFLARRFDISPDTEVTLTNILRQQGVTSRLRQLCDANIPVDYIMGTVEIEDEDEVVFESEVAVPLLRKVSFGIISVVIAVVLAGSASVLEKQSGGWASFRIEKPRRVLLRHYVVQDADDHIFQVDLLHELMDELEEKGWEVVYLT